MEMKNCNKCGIGNPDDAVFCRNCGSKWKEKIRKKNPFWRILLIIALLSGVCWLIWYLSMPSYIRAEKSYVTLDPTGGTKTIFVYTDADYDDWSVNCYYSSWITVEKTTYGISISYDANETDDTRTAAITMYTYGRYFSDRIELTQGPDNSIRGSIEKVWVDYNAYDEYDRSGIRIHVKFSVKNMKGVKGQCAAYFYNSETSTALNDYNGSYCTVDDKVAVSKNFTPSYDSSKWDDFKLFIPDDELHLSPGNWKLYFNVRISDDSKNKTLCNSDKHGFSFNKAY